MAKRAAAAAQSMTTREEIRERRIQRLLDQLEAAAAHWAAAEHQDGLESGRPMCFVGALPIERR